MKTDADAPRSVATAWSGVDIYAAKPPDSGSRLLFGAHNLFRKLFLLSLVCKIDNPLYHIKTSTIPLELIVLVSPIIDINIASSTDQRGSTQPHVKWQSVVTASRIPE